MTFESLWPLAFLLAVPIIIIFYLIVPKGKDTKISSNLLWNKLFVNRQSKTFLEKFLHNILMYLQIVVALLLVLALMTPYMNRKGNSNALQKKMNIQKDRMFFPLMYIHHHSYYSLHKNIYNILFLLMNLMNKNN